MEKLSRVDRMVTIPVDIENDFTSGGALPVPHGEEVILPMNNLVDFTTPERGIVAATQENHKAPSQDQVFQHFVLWGEHGVEKTWGAAFHPDLELGDNAVIIRKGMGQTDGYSGFEGISDRGQTLESLITPTHKEHVAVLIGGLATEYCVLNTVLDAMKLAEKVRRSRLGNVTVYAIADAMRAVNINEDDGYKAIQTMKKAGAIFVNSEDVINGRVFEI